MLNIKWKSPKTIVFLVLIVITAVCFCLVNTWGGFAIAGSVCLVLAMLMATFKTFLDYKIFKRTLADQKLCDAYLYAEEFGDEEQIKNFAYDKKTNRKIRYAKFNKMLLPLACFAVLVCAVFMFLICTKII